ncbi:dimethyl sulfoxide reductase anchor subunit family protein [Endozoicomonas lisbonensis]|uniref:DMSO reductase anchor subunit n=1 Tax=Endozoicomonas lisbonensis TaxID=3120522 RepID=A0ABV2SP14_9GAMM
MSDYQLSLVFFTIFCQWGVGSVLGVTLYCSLPEAEDRPLNTKAVAALIWLICLVGSLCLLSQLDNPAMAYRALFSAGGSWLSREVTASVILNGCTTLWMVSYYADGKKGVQQLLGGFTSVLGLIAILVSAQVYFQAELHPEWNTLLTHLTFLSTALTLGMATVIVFIRAYGHEVPLTIRYLQGFSVIVTLVVMTLFVRHLDYSATHNLLTAYQLLGSVLAGGLLFVMVRNSGRYRPEWMLVTALVMVSGEIAGRLSFYSSMTAGAPW